MNSPAASLSKARFVLQLEGESPGTPESGLSLIQRLRAETQTSQPALLSFKTTTFAKMFELLSDQDRPRSATTAYLSALRQKYEKAGGLVTLDPEPNSWNACRLALETLQEQYQPPRTEARFRRLLSDWKAKRDPYDSGISNMLLPAYQQIIGLGPDCLRLIFAELERETDDWFWALRAITGDDPVADKHVGNSEAMRSDWLEWAAVNGYR